MISTLWTLASGGKPILRAEVVPAAVGRAMLRCLPHARGAVVGPDGRIDEERDLRDEHERRAILDADARWRAGVPADPDEAVGIGAATEAPVVEAPLPVAWEAPVVEAPSLSTTADLSAAPHEELTRLQVLLAEERGARVAVEEELEALAASLRERSAQLDAARRDLEVSRVLRATQADTIRRLADSVDNLANELDTARPDRVRRERQNTRRRVERVCAAMAKHLARRAAR